MKDLIKKAGIVASTLTIALSTPLFAQQASSLADLLNMVENDRVAESDAYRQRLQEFEQNANRQEEILTTTNERITAEEATQAQLSDQFQANEITIADLRGDCWVEPRLALATLLRFGAMVVVAFSDSLNLSLSLGRWVRCENGGVT